MYTVWADNNLGMNIIHKLLTETPLLSPRYTPLNRGFIHNSKHTIKSRNCVTYRRRPGSAHRAAPWPWFRNYTVAGEYLVSGAKQSLQVSVIFPDLVIRAQQFLHFTTGVQYGRMIATTETVTDLR